MNKIFNSKYTLLIGGIFLFLFVVSALTIIYSPKTYLPKDNCNFPEVYISGHSSKDIANFYNGVNFKDVEVKVNGVNANSNILPAKVSFVLRRIKRDSEPLIINFNLGYKS